ncbi:MAG: hypothetical protein R3Y54_08160 [Eubacteriales bacterium]
MDIIFLIIAINLLLLFLRHHKTKKKDGQSVSHSTQQNYSQFNRYGDISKFISDESKLAIVKDPKKEDGGFITISSNKDYYIDFALDFEQVNKLDELKEFILLIIHNIGAMDNMVLKYYKNFSDYELNVIYIEEQNKIVLDYWSAVDCNQCEVVFCYENNTFTLKAFGNVFDIPNEYQFIATC